MASQAILWGIRMMRYFTVKNATAGDISAADSGVSGVDSNGITWALLKFKPSTSIPTWGGTAVELEKEEAECAGQSALYTGTANGSLYRQESQSAGLAVVEFYVQIAASIPTVSADFAQTLFRMAALSGIQGFVPLLRMQLVLTPVTPSIGYTSLVKSQMVGLLDAWLDKFPPLINAPASVTAPVAQYTGINDTDNNLLLQVGGQYLVESASAGAFTVELPPNEEQSGQTDYAIIVDNISSHTVTINVHGSDSGVNFRSGGTSYALAAGSRVRLETAQDGANRIWLDR
jgi:hypothetical protein